MGPCHDIFFANTNLYLFFSIAVERNWSGLVMKQKKSEVLKNLKLSIEPSTTSSLDVFLDDFIKCPKIQKNKKYISNVLTIFWPTFLSKFCIEKVKKSI